MTVIPGGRRQNAASFLSFGRVALCALHHFKPVACPDSFLIAESVGTQLLPHVSFTHALARSNETFLVSHSREPRIGREQERDPLMTVLGSGKQSLAARSVS